MQVEMKQWEVERVKEIVSDILDLRMYDSVEAKTYGGRLISMSKKTFLESLERSLKNPLV